MHGSEVSDIVRAAEKDRQTVACSAENSGNKAFRERSHSLGRPVLRVFRRYTVILKPFVGDYPEQICTERACKHSGHDSQNVVDCYIHNQ